MGKAKRRIGVKLDMTPMVDVAFLLLIFFMSTTQFKPPEEVSVNLPACTSDFQVPMSGIIVLTVTQEGKIYIGNESGAAAEVPKGDIASAIMGERSKRPGARLIIKGDKNASFGAVQDVIDGLQLTKTLRFNLMTELERDTEADKAAKKTEK
jgi:biopolymer transport protein ExbD